MLKYSECFRILEIEQTDDADKIKKAFAEMIKKYHPEDNPDEYKKVREAYNVLMQYSNNSNTPDRTPILGNPNESTDTSVIDVYGNGSGPYQHCRMDMPEIDSVKKDFRMQKIMFDAKLQQQFTESFEKMEPEYKNKKREETGFGKLVNRMHDLDNEEIEDITEFKAEKKEDKNKDNSRMSDILYDLQTAGTQPKVKKRKVKEKPVVKVKEKEKNKTETINQNMIDIINKLQK